MCHTGNCIFLKEEFKDKINYSRNLLNNPNILFDISWLNKRESVFKKLFLKLVPLPIIEFTRKIKNFFK